MSSRLVLTTLLLLLLQLGSACDGCTGPGPDAGPPDSGPRLDGGGPAARLVVNELLARNVGTNVDEAGEADDWLELHNATDEPLDVSGFGLSDDRTGPPKLVLSPGTLVPARGFLLVWADAQPAQGPLHAPFKLSGDGEVVLLTDAEGAPLDDVVFGPQVDDRSVGRFPDGQGPLGPLAFPTPGAANPAPGADAGVPDAGARDAGPCLADPTALRLNELAVVPGPSFLDDQLEPEAWIELFNPGATPADTTGLTVSVDPARTDEAPLPQATLAPGGFLVVAADGEPLDPGPHLSLRLPPERLVVTLYDRCGGVVDALDNLSDPLPLATGFTAGKLPDGAPGAALLTATPGLANRGRDGADPSDGGPDAGLEDGGSAAGGDAGPAPGSDAGPADAGGPDAGPGDAG